MLPDAGCQSVRFRDVRHPDVAEIFLEDHPDAAGRRVAVDHRVESDRELQPDAFLAVRRGDSDRAPTAVRGAQGIAGPKAAVHRSDVVRPLKRVQFQRDSRLRAAALEVPQVVGVRLLEPLPVELASSDALDERPDVQLRLAPPWAQPPDAAELPASVQLLPERWLVEQERLAHRAPQAPRAKVQALDPPVSQSPPEREPQPELGARPWLSPPQSSPLPQQPQPPQDPENASAQAPRAQYRSSSSASSFP